jgi:hypothetical protein
MGQFLKCISDSSRIVLLTIQELSKAQCNNTDNNYTDYSDTDLILSSPEWSRNDKMQYTQDGFETYSHRNYVSITFILIPRPPLAL